MKILLLNTQMEAAGAQKALLSLAAGLKARGHHVVVVTMYDKADYISLFEEQYGLSIINLNMKPAGKNIVMRVSKLLTGLFALFQLMRRERIQVIQTFSHYSNMLGPLLAWLAGVPVRLSSQRMSLRGAPKWLLTLDTLVANSFLVQKMTSVSEGTRQFCIRQQGIRADKIQTIYNGIDPSVYQQPFTRAEQPAALHRELGLDSNAVVMTTIARLHPQKGHSFLIEAIPQIVKSIPNARLLFVGEGALRAELERRAARVGATNLIRFAGVRQDISQVLAISDLFVLPSLWEGLPNVVLEAMAAGVPVVATDVDGSAELIIANKTGMLVPPKQSDALATAIIQLWQDEPCRKRIIAAAAQQVEQSFSLQRNVTAYETLYETLIQQRLAPPRQQDGKRPSTSRS